MHRIVAFTALLLGSALWGMGSPAIAGDYYSSDNGYSGGGYYGGVSGSPWITDYQDDARSGHVIGNLGGYNGGGNDANVDYISYAPAFGSDAATLLADAIADRQPPSNLPPYQGIQAKLPGGAALWQHAKLLASGDYTGNRRSDMIVVWSDA